MFAMILDVYYTAVLLIDVREQAIGFDCDSHCACSSCNIPLHANLAVQVLKDLDIQTSTSSQAKTESRGLSITRDALGTTLLLCG